MIGYRVMTQDLMDRVLVASERAAAGNVRAMAFLVMVTARLSIQDAPQSVTRRRGQNRRRRQRIPSPVGTPPYTHGGRLPAAIGYAVERTTAVIGTQYSRIGTGGEPHEQGGDYMGDEYPLRSFMGPALAETEPKLGPSFAGSIGEP